MSIKIGQASIDERGQARGGQVGDQTGKEVKIGPWYQYDPPWNVYLECPDKAMAERAAAYMERICKNDKIGYDQSQRTSAYESIVAHHGDVEAAEGECDCSSTVSACYRLAGLDINVGNTTSTLRQTLKAKGFKIYTDKEHLQSDKYATRGGIYLCEGHHVIMALEDGPAVIHWKDILKISGVSGDWEERISKLINQGGEYKYIGLLIEKVYEKGGM